jgi:hypothetical protein
MSSQDHWSDWTEEGRPFIETGEVRTKPESESPKEDRKMTKEELDEFEINETGLSSDSEDEKAVDGKVYYPNDGSRPFIVLRTGLCLALSHQTATQRNPANMPKPQLLLSR